MTTDIDWLQAANSAFEESASYFDSSIRKGIEESLAHNQSRHAPGSKYYKEGYRHRHKGFRPKTRTMTLRREADAAVALFSTEDIISVSPAGDTVQDAVAAEINKELLQNRLHSGGWFQTAIGAYQDANVTGIVISHQTWLYEEAEISEPIVDESGNIVIGEDGIPMMRSQRIVVEDRPAVELRPIENVMFSKAADWVDPINSSPFIIDQVPMTIDSVKALANRNGGVSPIRWLDASEEALSTAASASSAQADSVRRQRDGKREDSTDTSYSYHGHNIVWVRRVIMRVDGIDMFYYTLGGHALLSEPIELIKAYPWLKPGERPYVLGMSVIESHRVYPDSPVKMVSSVQKEANEINNTRRDNVALALNKRWFAREGANIDAAVLQRLIPGSVLTVGDINADIREERVSDVTASSYHEQDRVNMDFDDLAGTFTGGTVGGAKNLSETVGGMDLMRGDADTLTEYHMRVFVQTWVRPVLMQVMALIQEYETDQALLESVARSLRLRERFGIEEITDALLKAPMGVEVNVGFGATNPRQRVERIAFGLSTVLNLAPGMAQRLNGEEVAKEVFGSLGYAGSSRFFSGEEAAPVPMEADAMQPDPRIELEREKLEMQREALAAELDNKELERMNRLELAYLKQEELLYRLAHDEKISMAQLEAKLRALDIERQNKVDEMKLKIRMGSGI